MKTYMRTACLIIVLLTAGAVVAWGQATTSLRGTVTDPSGAAIPGAKVTLTNAATNLPRETITGANGAYYFASVLPGPYKLTAEASGFRTFMHSGLQLLVNLPSTLNVRLQVGAVSQTVQVTSRPPVLNTTDASVGNTMGSLSINQLPLRAENMPLLLSFQPGVVYNGDKILTDDYDTRAGSVNGERSDQNNITLDGVSINNEFAGYAFNGVLPTTQFSVQEFRVTTSNYGATQGRSAGAQIAMVTKGGTNQFHGSLYEFNRSNAGEANDYFLKLSELANGKPNVPTQLTRNVFGGTLGGPILKDRFFFFVNYEGHRVAEAQSELRTIPSATLRQGIIQYACSTPSQCPGGSVTGASGGNFAVQPGYYELGPAQLKAMDPQGIGPSPVALKYFNTYPLPNDFSVLDVPNYAGYRFASRTLTSDNWFIGRLDYKLTQNAKQTLFFRWTSVDDPYDDVSFLPGEPPEDTSLDLSKGFVAGYTAILSPRWVNNFRYGLTRQSISVTGDSTLPWVFMRDLDQGISRPNGAVNPVHNFVDTVSGVIGSHNFQFGGNILLIRRHSYDAGNSFSDALTNSDWLLSGGFANTNDPLNPAYGCTNSGPCYPAVATDFNHSYDFPLAAMMGIASEIDAQYNYTVVNPTTASPLAQGAPVVRHWATDTYSLFAEDTWRARPNLSISYGLNYQLMTPITETDGQEVTPTVNMGTWFNTRGANMLKGIGSNQDQTIVFGPSGSFWGKSGVYSAQTRNFAPRVGVAWSPAPSGGWLKQIFGSGQTSIRAGFGVYYSNFGPELALNYDANGSFGLVSSISNPAHALTTATAPRITSMNVIPTTDANGNIIMPPAPPSTYPSGLTAGTEEITQGLDQSLQTPYSYAADFSIERALPHQVTFGVDYVGHFGNRLMVLDDIGMPTDLVDPKSDIDYFAAASRLSQLWRANTPESSITPSLIGRTAQYWADMLKPLPSYTLTCSTGLPTTNLLEAVYDVFGPGCGNLYNETSAIYDIDVAGFPTFPATGANSYFNSQYSSLWTWRSIADSNYNALEVSLHKQFSNGVLFGFNYTYSHSLDIESMAERGVHYLTDSVINAWDPNQMYGPSDFDLRHQINGYWVAQLPLGRGKPIGRNANGWLDALIGGWQLSGTTRWTSGYAASVFMGYVWPTNWDEMGWANLTGTPIPTGRTSVNGTPNVFSNQSQAAQGFAYAFPGQSGVRNPVRGDGFFDWDASLAKTWKMPWKESQTLQFRWNVYNVTNTPSFDVYSMQDEWDSASTFGDYSQTLSKPRVMEFSLVYQF